MANFRSRYVIESEQWDGPEAKALAADAGAAGEDNYEYATFAAGFAAARRSDMSMAREYLERLVRSNGTTTATITPGTRGVTAVPVILELALGAELARQTGHIDSALALLHRAAALEETMPAEFGPPAVVQPTYELLGALYLQLGRNEDAASAFERALQLQPGRSAALLGLSRAERGRGRLAEGLVIEQRLASNWAQADSNVRALIKQ
jgi:tetratricopeptide (TPR) repeat protein